MTFRINLIALIAPPPSKNDGTTVQVIHRQGISSTTLLVENLKVELSCALHQQVAAAIDSLEPRGKQKHTETNRNTEKCRARRIAHNTAFAYRF